MVQFFHCELCHSKVLEKHLQKHLAKVHAGIDYDTYTPLTTNDASAVASNIDTNSTSNQYEDIAPPADADAKLVRVACTVCGHQMSSIYLDRHMKKKHNDAGDQVDAVGIQTKVDSMSFDMIEKSESAKGRTEATQWTTNWLKIENPFIKSTWITATPKIDASTTTNPDLQEPFYDIRVTVDQMKQLMSENRIDPKDGYFYLK